ncbi:MAG: Gfo/Idh/MocA family oxidoreductase [candidate division Zixibacteria bacterium]
MKKVKTAVVGVGSLGRHHLKWLSKLGSSDLVGLFDIDSDRAAEYASEYGVKSFSSLGELSKSVEAVSIVVPTSAHFEVASELIEARIHCLIEKPVTVTVEQANKLAVAAKDSSVCVSVGHIERFNPAVAALRNEKMHPSFIEGHRLAAFDPRGTDVAVVLDLMIHDIDLVLSMVDSEIVDTQASAVAVVSDQADIANARLTFANGAVANLTASRISLGSMRKLRIFQKSGYFSLDLAAKQADIYQLAELGDASEGMKVPIGKSEKNLLYRKVKDSGEDMLKSELDAFLGAVRNKRKVEVTLEEATEALRVAMRVNEIGLASIKRML